MNNNDVNLDCLNKDGNENEKRGNVCNLKSSKIKLLIIFIVFFFVVLGMMFIWCEFFGG